MKAFFKGPIGVIPYKEAIDYIVSTGRISHFINEVPYTVERAEYGLPILFHTTLGEVTLRNNESLLRLPHGYIPLNNLAVEDWLDLYNDNDFAVRQQDDSTDPKQTVTAEVDKVNVRLLSVRLDSKFKGVATFKSGEHTLTFPITDYKTLTTLNRGNNFRLVLEEDLNPIELPK